MASSQNIDRIERVGRIAVAAVLMVAGVSKALAEPSELEGTVVGHFVRSDAELVSLGVLEGAIAMWLMLTNRAAIAWLFLSVLFAGFTAALWRYIYTGNSVACGCFGVNMSGEAGGLLFSAVRATFILAGSTIMFLVVTSVTRVRQSGQPLRESEVRDAIAA